MEAVHGSRILPQMILNQNYESSKLMPCFSNPSKHSVDWHYNPNDSKSSVFGRRPLSLSLQRKDIVVKTRCSAGVCTYSEGIIKSRSHTAEEKIGVLLLNLGGPDTLNDVQPFLFNLFTDPDIIRLPRLFRFLQRPLAQLISVLRAPKSKKGYASIGGGSPLRKITDEQASALKSALDNKEVSANVYVTMRYWHPFTEEAVHQVMIFFSAHASDFLIMQELKSRGVFNDHTLAYQHSMRVIPEPGGARGRQGVKSLLAV